jgi:hypothetical protein
MTVSFAKLRKLIHRKSFEFLTINPFGNTGNGAFMCGDDLGVMPDHSHIYAVFGASNIYRYNADEDSWLQLPNSGIAGAFGAGACGEFRAMGAPGGQQTLTATGGSATTIATNLTLARSIKGCRIRIIAGPGMGFDGRVLHNTMGANAVITLDAPAPAAPSAASQFQLFSGALWFFCPGTTAVGFRVYDVATNAWAQRSISGLPTAFGTDGQLIGTGSAQSNAGSGFVIGTATDGGAASLFDSTKNWPTNGWAQAQLRLTSGTGRGQIRTIAANTATGLTLATPWATAPDATSGYVIEGNDDFFYLMGNNATTLYRYSASADLWTTITPSAARSGAPGGGFSANYADNIPAWAEDQAGAYQAYHASGILRQNGRYIFSFRGTGTNILDVYDIAANTWFSALAYGAQSETFTTGSSSVDADGKIYLQKDNTGRFFYFDIGEHKLEPLMTNPLPQGTAVAGAKMALMAFQEGGDTGRWLYALSNSRAELVRVFLV